MQLFPINSQTIIQADVSNIAQEIFIPMLTYSLSLVFGSVLTMFISLMELFNER
jgi:hypothetical protein